MAAFVILFLKTEKVHVWFFLLHMMTLAVRAEVICMRRKKKKF